MEVSITNYSSNRAKNKNNSLDNINVSKLNPEVRKVYIRMYMLEYISNKIVEKVEQSRQEEINDKIIEIISGIDDCLLEVLTNETIIMIASYVVSQSSVRGILINKNEFIEMMKTLQTYMS